MAGGLQMASLLLDYCSHSTKYESEDFHLYRIINNDNYLIERIEDFLLY